MTQEGAELGSEAWRGQLALLAGGLLTPHQGKKISSSASRMRLNEAELLHRAFRSMVVALISDRAPSHALIEWAQVTKVVAASIQMQFPGTSERFVSLRCMLLEAAEQTDWKDGEQALRPAVGEMSTLLSSRVEPMTVEGISEALGIDEHAAAKRIRLAILTGHAVAHYDDWKTIRISSAAVAA
jgi:hypothetical protein